MKTILILEDELPLLNLVRRMLAPYSVLEAGAAEQAIRQFRTHRQIDLLLADVSLPDMSGIRVALLLRAENPDLAVILASGYPRSSWNKQELADLDRLGSDSVSVIEKPFSSTILLDRVSQLIGAPSAYTAHSA